MNTFLYLVRHGESPKVGDERTRGLTQKGEMQAQSVKERLKMEGINSVISSPYLRSIHTVEQLAIEIGQPVLVNEDLKERIFSNESNRLSDKELIPLLQESFSNPDYALEGAESNGTCQERAIKVVKELLETYRGRKVVIGTHGAIMTLILHYYDKTYDLNFLLNTSKPDIYRLEFHQNDLVDVKRIWSS